MKHGPGHLEISPQVSHLPLRPWVLDRVSAFSLTNEACLWRLHVLIAVCSPLVVPELPGATPQNLERLVEREFLQQLALKVLAWNHILSFQLEQ